MFKDAWNPTQEEIKAWAYDAEAYAPEQDFELAVAETQNIPMICGFVNDESCPKRKFFLSSLYVYTGDIVRSKNEKAIHDLTQLLNTQAQTAGNTQPLADWLSRSAHLIRQPESYTYEFWGMGSQYVYPKEVKAE